MPKVILIDCFVWQKQQRSDIVLRDTRGGLGSARDDSGEWHGGRELLSTRLRRVCLKVSLILQLVYLVKSSGSENSEKQHTSLRPEQLNRPSSSLLLRPAPTRREVVVRIPAGVGVGQLLSGCCLPRTYRHTLRRKRFTHRVEWAARWRRDERS